MVSNNREAFLPEEPDYSLKKSDRLCSKKAFDFLFTKGKTFFHHPLKVIYASENSELEFTQVAFGASKRNFKNAVDRNKVKRLLREVYRKNKLLPRKDHKQYLMIVYITKKIESYANIEASLIKSLNELKAYIEKHR